MIECGVASLIEQNRIENMAVYEERVYYGCTSGSGPRVGQVKKFQYRVGGRQVRPHCEALRDSLGHRRLDGQKSSWHLEREQRSRCIYTCDRY